ncbi:MAG: DUF4389 domain-containing protein [Candidatus Dormibacteria bacterium]
MTYAPPPPPPGYPPQPPPGYPAAPPPGYPAPPAGYQGGSSGHPVQLTIQHQATYSRGLGCLGFFWFLGRALLAIPVAIWLYILFIIAEIVAWIMQIVVIFTGSYPQGAHSFVTGVLRLYTRTAAFILGLTDAYPGFGINP